MLLCDVTRFHPQAETPKADPFHSGGRMDWDRFRRILGQTRCLEEQTSDISNPLVGLLDEDTFILDFLTQLQEVKLYECMIDQGMEWPHAELAARTVFFGKAMCFSLSPSWAVVNCSFGNKTSASAVNWTIKQKVHPFIGFHPEIARKLVCCLLEYSKFNQSMQIPLYQQDR